MASQSSPNGMRMPKRLDDPDQLLLWPMDEFAFVATIFGIGITAHQLTACIVVIFFSLKGYRRYREGRPRGYLLHLLYWYGFAGRETVTLRNPFIRNFYP
jgi:conjugal transfer pilus assembly protein TraL